MAMLLCAFSANAQGGSVAKIGSTEYTTFADAMAAANAATGNVNVEVYGAVEFVDGMELNGSYTAITFTGKSAEAKITINQTAGGDYLTAHGKTVAFNGLILAKANPAWSGNSGHMGNYFSIQGGTVTYTDCTFPNGACTNTGTAVYNNCTFQNASEYGLWVYDDALVTVNGGTIDSKKGIKVYSEGEQDVTSTLTVQNATFTENVTAKPAVAVGYAQSITLIGNTYNNTTAHVELDSGSDADCEGITFVAQDSEGNDIASTLEMTDRSNSSAPCGVLVDGKIYTTVTTAAAEATEGSTVTLLYNSTEEVELPEGVVLDKNGYTANNVTVATSGVAKVGENVFTTVLEALQYAIDNNAAELKILCDVREKMTIDFDLNINADLTITADAPVKVEFYNDGTSYDFAVGSTNNNTLTIGENVHFDLVDRVIWLGYWGNNVTVVVNGYLGGYQIWHGANTIVKGTLDSHGEAFIMRRDATLTANEGAKVNANYFQIYSGHIVAENATITAGLVWVNNNHNYGNEGTVSFELDNTEFTSNGEVKIYAGEGKIVSVTLENSSLFDAKGVVTLGDNVKVVADATSSIQDANGSVVIPVAKIGETSYASLAEALTAASAMSGDVTIEVYDKVTLNTSFSGSYSSINFVGKDTDAEIYLDVQGYITATGKKVSFTDLTLSKSQGGYITNAGFMNVAFGIYDVTEVTYTNCVFANGAYASSGNVTFNDCTFYRSYDKYGLWAYGDVNATVEGCTFADYRGIKMYAEGAAKTVDLTVKNTDFSAVTDKPAIVLTYGESVVLEGNTYSSTGTFELDLDGAPNGTAVTSDVAPTCKNDNGTCGVLVDGNIYTTVAQAADVAAAGSNVTLLYSTTDAVEFAEGVNLTLANGVIADNVTVATSAVAKIGDTTYATLAEAVAAATEGATITMLADAAEDVTLPAGVTFNGNGKAVGNLTAGGEITFTGVTKATSFGVQYTNTTVNIVPGACLEITGSGRMVIGHGCTFNITGSIEDAKTADVAALTPSLIMPGASFTGAGVTFNVTNAYISAPSSYCSSSSSASGTFDFNITNSIWESAGKLAFESQSVNATVDFDLKNSVLNTGSHLVFGVSRGEVVIDNSNVNVGTSRQIENQSTMTIKNGSVVNGAVATSSNAKNPGTIIVDNATYAVTGEFSGSDLGTGTIIVKNGATVSAGSITKANIQIDATGMAAGDEVNLTADLSNFAGTIEVVNNNLDAKIVDGKIVLVLPVVAKIGDVEYASLADAVAAAESGATITLMNGEHELPLFAGKELTFVGESKEGVIVNDAPAATTQGWNGSTFHFENLTAKGATENYHGLANGVVTVTYKNCNINGLRFLYATEGVTFDGCAFNAQGVEHSFWTYGASNVTVKNSTFTYTDRAVNCYSENGANHETDITFEGCSFTYAGTADAPAGAVEINSGSVKSFDIAFNGCTAPEKGAMWFNSQWDSKNGENTVVSVDGEIVWQVTPAVAKIGETSYATLEEAFAAAAEGETITLLADATPALTSQRAITKAAVIDLGGNTLTLTEDDLYFGTTTFKNGTIVVDPSVKPSTAVFWMFANQTLTFDAVKVVATGVTGTYLIGLDGNNSDLNLLNGSEILIENTTALDLDVICVNASTGNDIVVENSKVNVTNLDGRVFFRGNYTVKDSEVSLAGITKAGFRIEAGQTLSIEGTSTVTIEGEPRDGGIHITDATATYTKAETATVNATVNAPAPAYVAQVGEQGYETLAAALTAAQAGETVTLLADVETADGIVITDKNLVIDLNGKTYTTTEGASTNNRNFKIEGTSVVTIKNGTMVAAGDYSSGAYGTVRTEGSANVTLEGLKLYNYRGNGLNIKACGSSVVTINDTEIYSNYGGGIESAGGTIEIANVKVEQKGMYTAPYNSMAISVNGGGKVTVNSGTFSTECITAEEANNQGTSHGPWVAGVLNSGGTLIINGGTFSNDNFGENSLATYARGAILADTKAKVEINGGKFNVLKNVIDIQNNLGDANNNPSVVLAGGTYNADPRISASYGSNLITLADGYAALPDLNGNYVVGVKPTATVNNLGMTTIAAGDYSIWNGSFDQNTEDDGDMPLSFVMQFLADQDAEDMATSPYADWYGDFVITFTGIENGSFTADGCYLAGHYGSFGWVKVPVDGMTIDEGARYPVMLGVGLGQKYDYICSSVEDFKCALYLTPEILAANPNIQVKLELAVVDNSKGSDAAASALVNNENVYSVTEYTYDAEDFVVDPNYIAELIIDDAEGEPYTNDTEKTVGKLTYVRTLPAAGIWYPVFLPFDVPAAALDAELFDVARINDFHTNFSEEDGSIEKMWVEYIVRKSGTLAAGKPFLVRAKNSNVLEMVIELEDVTLYPADKKSTITVSSVITKVTFEGVYESLDAPVSTPSTRYLAVNAAGVWDEFDGYSLNPFRVMMTLRILDEEYYISSAASLSVGARVIGEENEDGTTTIYDVEVDRENCEDLIFDLQGRRVLEPEKGCIYIKNGKKIIF